MENEGCKVSLQLFSVSCGFNVNIQSSGLSMFLLCSVNLLIYLTAMLLWIYPSTAKSLFLGSVKSGDQTLLWNKWSGKSINTEWESGAKKGTAQGFSCKALNFSLLGKW